MENKEIHYKVDARIDGKWFSNEYVFETWEIANEYGKGLVENGGADKFRLIETAAPVKTQYTEIVQDT